jgi:hypothetical protein
MLAKEAPIIRTSRLVSSTRRSSTMTSTLDHHAPRAAAAAQSDADDTIGFGSISTTRSNIPRHPAVATFGLSGLAMPSFEPPAPSADDTTGFGVLNTTRSNIKGAAVLGLESSLGQLRPMPSLGGVGLVPEVGSEIAIKENGVR